MRPPACALLFVLLACAGQAFAADVESSFDVAPTTLELKAGEPGLFYVTNHGARPAIVQIEALDWRQADADVLTPSDTLTPSDILAVSPPQARIAPGSRQTVRVLARRGGGGETAYRLRVSELPDPGEQVTGVHVMLQFLVPVFVDHRPLAPTLQWDAVTAKDGVTLKVRNDGVQPVKLTALAVNGQAVPGEAFTYVLPQVTRAFTVPAAAGALHVTGHDARSGKALAADFTAHP